MPAVIYARFSDRPNADACESVDAQLELAREWCRRQGLDVRAECTDRAVSGGHDDFPPGLAEALGQLRKGDVLVVWRRDRIARNVYRAASCERVLRAAGCSLHVLDGINTDGPEGELINTILDAVAAYERKVGAKRTSAMMRSYQRQGRRMSAQPPIGFRVDPDDPARLIPHEREQAAIVRARALRDQAMSLRAIGEQLAAEGFEPRGARWDAKTVQRMLSAR